MSEEITELEIRVAHLESTLDELNAIVAQQQEQIDRLTRETLHLASIANDGDGIIRPPADDVPPPHY